MTPPPPPINDRKITQAFAAAVRRRRTERGWSLRELADASGVSHTTVWTTEQGDRQPSLINALKIASGLGVAITDLITIPSCARCHGQPPPGFRCKSCGTEA